KVKVPVIGLVDTDTNPKMVQYIIPGNDDALRSIQLVIDLVIMAIKEGQSKAESAKIK
ncbi:TPA: 30S ribosomal protein S2, partial [Candidatus Veblenbacteria bacterium]|nr:30S ribosomal protein S2 [Candidatus Veblenbacteria bacterium]